MSSSRNLAVCAALTLASVGAFAQAPGVSAAEHMRRAQQDLVEKKPALAIPELREVVKLDPANIDAQANLGVLLYFSGSYAEAIPSLRAAVAAQPGLGKIQALLGLSEQRTGDLDNAAKDLQTALPQLAEKQIHIQAGLALVEVDQASGALDKAAQAVSELRAAYPDDPAVLSASYQVYQQGMNESLLALAVAAPDSAQLPYIMGQRLVQQGQGEQAIVLFRKALAIQPNLPGLRFSLASALQGSSNPTEQAEAQGVYAAAVQADPFDEKSWLGLAGIASDKGDNTTAATDYGKALSLQPSDAEADTGLAKVLVAENQKPKAIELLEHAVQADPTNITAHYRLSTLYRQAGREADARQQLALYEHYKALRAQLETSVKSMRGASTPADGSAQP